MTFANADGSDGGLEDDPCELTCKIKVCLWMRLMSKLEESRRSRNCIHVNNTFPRPQVMVDSPIDGEIFDFTFDGVFEEDSSNVCVELNHLYQESVLSIIQSFVQGYNGCIGIYGQTGTGKDTVLGERLSEENYTGVLPLLINDMFDMLMHSPNQWEYILRCSYVELYMEKLFDLLMPSNSNIFIPPSSSRISLQNVSELCCIHPSDVFQLLVRGNANRKCITSSPDILEQGNINWRSHTFLIFTLEQRNTTTNHTRLSTFTIIDFAGSEWSATPTIKKYGADGLMEAKLIHHGFHSLHGYVRSCCSSSLTSTTKPVQPEQYQYSKLTQILRHAIGGNCKTSFIITASPSSCSIQETLNTFRFAQELQAVENENVRINQYQSILDTEHLRKDLNNTLRLILQYQHEESNEQSSLILQEKLHYLLSKYCGEAMNDKSIFDYNDSSPHGKLENEDWNRIITALQNNLSQTEDQRGQAEGKLGELQSEVSMLRSFNRLAKKEQEKLQKELIESKKETQILSQKCHELERKLRTSAFRESQATVFLRQFRRFYRRLLKHKATMGTGDVKEIIQRLPGVPDLNDLIDVDTLLYEAGLIEETEKADDRSVATFRPSENSLTRSFKAAKKLAKTSTFPLSEGKISSPQAAGKDFYVDEDEEYDDDDAASAETKSTSTSVTQSVTRHPSAVQSSWSSEREDELQALKEEYLSLQTALNDEKMKLSAILDGAGHPIGLKKLQVECMTLKRGLSKKCHDLEAVIWKMNELHLINKTYSEKMSNREKHVLYLEETVQELQRQNRILMLDKQSGEDKFREESKIWHNLIDSLRFPLWQIEEQPVNHSPVTSRILIPVVRNEHYEEAILQSSSQDSPYESMQDPYKTFTSTAVQSEEIWPITLADKDYVEVSTQTEKPPDETKSFLAASTQTVDMPDKKCVAVQTDVQTDSLVITAANSYTSRLAHSVGVQTDSVHQCIQKTSSQVPTPNPSKESASVQGDHVEIPLGAADNVITVDNNYKMRDKRHKISNPHCFAPLPATIVLDANDDVSHITSDHFFPGGKGSNYVPKRFAQKIRPNKPSKK